MKISVRIYLFIRFFYQWLVYKTLPVEDQKLVEKDLERYKRWCPNMLFHSAIYGFKGFRATFYWRIKNKRKRIMCEILAKSPENIELASMEKLGGGIFMPHSIGRMVNAKSIGDNCTILQGVTVGGGKETDIGGNPLIGDNVYIGANATVLGGVRIGNNVTIGGGSVVVKDIPDNAVVAGNPSRVLYFKDADMIDISGLPPQRKDRYITSQ